MNICIFGNTCLTHYLTKRFSQYPNVQKIFVYGLDEQSTDLCKFAPPPEINNTEATKEYYLNAVKSLKDLKIDFIITTSITFQLWPAFQNEISNTGIPALLPSGDIAKLEWSKEFSKSLFKSLEISTPDYTVVSHTQLLDTFWEYSRPFVLKFDKDYSEGLQTIVVTDDNKDLIYKDISNIVDHNNLFEKRSPDDQKYVIEQFVSGPEYSYHVICNGTDAVFLGAARDYKKIHNNDLGHNTVGMGSYSPVSNVNHVVTDYANKILKYYKNIGSPFNGIMYLGVIVHNNIPYLIEVNTRFGCPEGESILETIDTNICDLLYNATQGLAIPEIKFNNKSVVSVRLVNAEYSGDYKLYSKNPVIKSVPADIIHTKAYGTKNVHSLFTATASTRQDAAKKIYDFLSEQDLGDFIYRSDIGYLE